MLEPGRAVRNSWLVVFTSPLPRFRTPDLVEFKKSLKMIRRSTPA
jgi:hypothetical protein